MAKSITFTEGFSGIRTAETTAQNAISMAFDWDKAAQIIKIFKEVKGFVAEAGLQDYWYYTSGAIFEHGDARSEEDTYLSSNWATPILSLSFGGESVQLECWVEENERFTGKSKWDKTSLNILNS